ncbi:hypothetical protein VA596_44905 [Amycolatopsis sp., V23-08]|uniref:DUF3040 domain-containing protein n=1 Tax=Amycolatopsis heterodermiae TaxID=3110235 RepID=A0ABU5RKM6_9PSEU|nr:hypothetical protein [Amycolatopsis sp., V23-08]MEA5366738.1 hypothetical protein [Amycolatopsis sp., V23-08]
MGVPDHAFPIARSRASRRSRIRVDDRNRWLLLVLVTFAVVPADDGGSTWAMVGTVAAVALFAVARRALRRAAAKVDAALADELDPR